MCTNEERLEAINILYHPLTKRMRSKFFFSTTEGFTAATIMVSLAVSMLTGSACRLDLHAGGRWPIASPYLR
jgi:hypothetical protein